MYQVKFLKGCLPQILLGLFLTTLSYVYFCGDQTYTTIRSSQGRNLFQPSVAFHVETSHLFCGAKQMTGFCMKRNTGLKWVKVII